MTAPERDAAGGTMEVLEIAAGLWRWTAPHPAWTSAQERPDGWPRMVGSVYHESADAIVLIDPLVPPRDTPEEQKFWTALDRDVARRGIPVVVLVGNRHHGRSARQVHERYSARVGARVFVPAAAVGHVACEPTDRFGPTDPLPGGVVARFLEGLDDPEVAYFLPSHRALVFADAVIGAGGGQVRVAPESWGSETPEGRARYRSRFRDSLRGLLELDFDRLLPSHGAPVLRDGRTALTQALDAPAWGEDARGE